MGMQRYIVTAKIFIRDGEDENGYYQIFENRYMTMNENELENFVVHDGMDAGDSCGEIRSWKEQKATEYAITLSNREVKNLFVPEDDNAIMMYEQLQAVFGADNVKLAYTPDDEDFDRLKELREDGVTCLECGQQTLWQAMDYNDKNPPCITEDEWNPNLLTITCPHCHSKNWKYNNMQEVNEHAI